MMPTYRCEALHIQNVTCFVEAETVEKATIAFALGQYDEFINVTGSEEIQPALETVKLDDDEGNP